MKTLIAGISIIAILLAVIWLTLTGRLDRLIRATLPEPVYTESDSLSALRLHQPVGMIPTRVILSVVWLIGGAALLLIAGMIYTQATGRPVDSTSSTLAGTALGYLGGILTSVRAPTSQPPPTL